MKVYLIKSNKTGEVIRWEDSLIDFVASEIDSQFPTDGMRRALANTKKRGTYYKGYKILFYGEEEPLSILKEELDEWYEDGEDFEEEYNTFDFRVDAEKTKEEKHMPFVEPKRNVLFIPDLHCPFDYVAGIELAKKVYKENNCTEVVFLGDVIDFLTISDYGTSPDFMSQTEEIMRTTEHLKAWHDAFPVAKVCTGNHTMRIKKRFEKSGIHPLWMNDFRTMFHLDGWDFRLYHEIGNFIATHGMGQNAKSRSRDLHKSIICGHLHTKFEASYNDGLWAIYGGCMIDIDHRAFEYGKFFSLPKLGFVVIKDIEGKSEIKMIPIKYDKVINNDKMNEMW